MIRILEEFGIDVVREFVFSDCKYKRPLRFDAYNSEYRVAFEYQGEQHYKPTTFGKISDEEAVKIYELNILRDQIKRDYCSENDIILVEIPYWEIDSMESYLTKKLVPIVLFR